MVFVTLALMYLNLWLRRRPMELSPLEEFEARSGVVYHLGSAAVGLVSMSIVLIGGDDVAMYSGISYSLLGVVHGTLGYRYGKRRQELHSEASQVA